VLVEIGKLYKKIDKNGAEYFVGDLNSEAGFIIMPVRQRGQIGEPAFKIYVRSREKRNEELGKRRDEFGNK